MYQIFYIRLSVLSYTLMIDGYSTKSGDTHISLSLEASIPGICCLGCRALHTDLFKTHTHLEL